MLARRAVPRKNGSGLPLSADTATNEQGLSLDRPAETGEM